MTVTKYPRDLLQGDRFLSHGTVVEVLIDAWEDVETAEPLAGQPCITIRGRREDTGREGAMNFGLHAQPVELYEPPATIWVSVSSHRARHTLASIVGRKTPEYGYRGKDHRPRGEYHCVPGRFADQIRRAKGLRVLAGRPNCGRDVFRRWS